jgi:hypothetical protein
VTSGNGIQGPLRLGQVTDCFVVPARRRKGIARRLAARVHDLLVEKGAETVRLQVVARNASSVAFWRSLGYEALEDGLERPALPKGAPSPGREPVPDGPRGERGGDAPPPPPTSIPSP